MTTIIMISQDSSVIIGPEDGDGGGSGDGGGGSPESKEESAEPKTPSGGAQQGEQKAKKREQLRERRYKNSLSTVESDESEELSNATNSNSSSAASTLSSGNSLGLELPTGQRSSASGTEGSSGSGGSRGTTAADSAFLSSPESCEEIVGKAKARARVAKPQRRSLPRTLSFSSGSSSSIFITSTPSATSKDDSALGSLGSPGESFGAPRGHPGTPVRSVPGKTYSSPANGPHGIKFYINSATGRADLKTTNGGEGLVTRSLGRIVEAPTLSLPENREDILAANSNVDSYCTANRKAPRKKRLPSTFSIYSDINDLQSLLRRQENILAGNTNADQRLQPKILEESEEEDSWNAADVCADIICSTEDDDDNESDEESSSDLTSSPLAAELASCCSSSSSKNSSAASSGKIVMPSGAHKHPHNSLLPELLRRRHHNGRRSSGEDEYLDSLLEDTDSSGSRSSSGASAAFEVTRPPRLLMEEEGRQLAANPSVESEVVRRRSKKAAGKFSYSALSLSSSRSILRRHTTYVKSTSNVSEAVEKESSVAKLLRPHVHSWHRNRGRNKNNGSGKKRMSMLWNSKVRTNSLLHRVILRYNVVMSLGERIAEIPPCPNIGIPFPLRLSRNVRLSAFLQRLTFEMKNERNIFISNNGHAPGSNEPGININHRTICRFRP